MKRFLTTFAGLPAGTTIIVRKNSNSHNYPLNIPMKMRRDGKDTVENDILFGKGRYSSFTGNNLQASDCEVGGSAIKDLEDELKSLESLIEVVKKKIAYCKERKLDEFDERLFIVEESLAKLDSNASNTEKAAFIAGLIARF